MECLLIKSNFLRELHNQKSLFRRITYFSTKSYLLADACQLYHDLPDIS